MRERVKTAVLLILVLSSLYLTGQLLFGQPVLETAAPPSYEQLVFGSLRPLSELVLPQLRLEEAGGLMLLEPWDETYNLAWNLAVQLLSDSDTPQNRPVSLPPPGDRLLILFPTPVDAGLWLKAHRLGGLLFTAVTWVASEPQLIWYRDAAGNWFEARLTTQSVEWSLLSEAFLHAVPYTAAAPEIWNGIPVTEDAEIIVPQHPPSLAPRATVRETMDTDKLLRSIFVNTALVRRIEERDGAVIYTDGQRGLRVFDYGELEYTAPNGGPGSEKMELVTGLRRTAQYLQLMGGWPEHLYLSSLKPIEKYHWNRNQWETYQVTFCSVQKGVRLLSAQPTVKLHFSDRGVIYYNRLVRILDHTTGEPKQLIHPFDAIKALSPDSLPAEAALTGLFPAYYLPPTFTHPIAQPVWAFTLDSGHTAIVHGHSGQFLTLLEQGG